MMNCSQIPESMRCTSPLPNHLHVEWSLKALEHGKHVLCEKPLSLSVEEILALMECAQSNPHLLVMEAFMYKFHPQWIAAKEIIHHGGIGDLRGIQSVFSFFDTDPQAIFNNNGYGGGSLMDIGCYSVSLSRFLFETEPVRVCSAIEFDPAFQTDRLTSGILEFEKGMFYFYLLYPNRFLSAGADTGNKRIHRNHDPLQSAG